jgi:phosphoribosylaminoimidazole carboxylase PurE protein
MNAIVIMGSPSDREFVKQITDALEALGLTWEARVASAHKTPNYLLDMLAEYESEDEPKVYITVAGRSNALSGMVDAAVAAPVIACPPYSGKFAGADIYSSLRAPSGVAPAVVLEPSNAALLAAKILGMTDSGVRDAVQQAQHIQRERLYSADEAA